MENEKITSLTEKAQTLIKKLEEISVITRLEALINQLEGLMPALSKPQTAPKPAEQKDPVAATKDERNIKEALESLSEVATTREVGEIRQYLLHRPTKEGEYSSSKRENNIFETMDQSEWIADIEETQNKQVDRNPIVSVWVPQDHIISVPAGNKNEGAWEGLGQNPYAKEFRVLVKPGKFELYQELKKAVTTKNVR